MKQKSENKGKGSSNESQGTHQSSNYLNKDSSIPTNFCQESPHKKLSNEMVSLREKVQEELVDIERKIYELETFYWNQTTDIGNMLRGWDGYATYNSNTGSIGGRKSSIGGNRGSCRSNPNVFSEKDRWFSLSSVTSPVDIEALGTTPNTGAHSGEMFSAAGSNVGSSISYHSESQCQGSELDNSVNCSRKQRR
ncbi:hypothetical protein [Cryptosporidium parvum Iowa II]|uniref:Uncharacterized protein n=2 Tax=Cryptosporidium parvum TaxID=5807 RepID=Q5CXD2_CRYPI|nr:hypothetical protein [Cryptosporidium parvum Iowa II]QOY41034.1 Chromatin modification-related protein Eaf6 [Cryptosporidium parvum]WKS78264.1 hypothetical protein CPCDC_6g1550 [Cryptosporidium sp. 43IA8]EAK89826.1 hypothetical protein cgd6_1550 [Cryptosporidium parvum Iowa II]WRK32753.1 Chromatin modification-related protein Eaf6 [Cryptosporidium parvum]CAD98700.1 hypothetical predicted protein, unknown function [Cryptosporidium parvum]|eukprot:QOY41034.1 hypothetical protein CPATCC_002676 [Cryptosporidium parvum]